LIDYSKVLLFQQFASTTQYNKHNYDHNPNIIVTVGRHLQMSKQLRHANEIRCL